ncbi:MAG: NAD(+) synthase [Synergistaceae bacterium]|nr:NAD(+) synthase [Synergistaceae bacterium]MBR1602821.1 NAD(+) synthase [Synergistaceae bacterium]
MREPEELVNYIQAWLKARVSEAGARGIIVGLSGGIDSAVVAALGRRAFGRENLLTLIMPCHSDESDANDAILVANSLDINYKIIELDKTFDALANEFSLNNIALSKLAQANLKARLRMSSLYAAAQTLNLLVCGTSNRSEYETGYFTKYGDSASDLLPLADLLKTQVRAIAKYLNIPEKIIIKAPSAGLWANQTDEAEMGFSYEQLDKYLETGEADSDVKLKIDAMHARSEHKRKPAPICKI